MHVKKEHRLKVAGMRHISNGEAAATSSESCRLLRTATDSRRAGRVLAGKLAGIVVFFSRSLSHRVCFFFLSLFFKMQIRRARGEDVGTSGSRSCEARAA